MLTLALARARKESFGRSHSPELCQYGSQHEQLGQDRQHANQMARSSCQSMFAFLTSIVDIDAEVTVADH